MTERVAASADELIGHSRLARNVLSGWTSQAVVIAAGFVTPRLIDSRLGPELLGIWDLGWALTAYATLLPGGSPSSIHRFVATRRAAGDEAGINRVVSSISALLVAIAALTVALGALAAWLLPLVFGDKLGAHVADARWVVLLLSVSLAVDVGLSGYGGVLKGFHRFDWFHGIQSATNFFTAAGYIAVLLLGGGVAQLAAVSLLGVVTGRLVRAVAARRVFPALDLRWRHVDRGTALEMARFGGKAFAPQVGDALLGQTTTLIVMAALGPTGVAMFARSRALIRNARTLVSRHATVIVPTAGALHAMEREDEIRKLLIDSTRTGLFITLPFVLLFSILGGPLLRAWMGPDFEQAALLAWMAGGYLFTMAMQPVLSVLTGMGEHGRPGVARVLGALAAIAGVGLVLGPLGGGLTGVGIALAVPLGVVDGIYLPVYACRKLSIPPARFLREAALQPILCALPLALSFAAAEAWFADSAWLALGTGAAGAFVLGGPLYWRCVGRGFVRDALWLGDRS